MGGRRNHFYTRHSIKFWVVLVQDFARASGLMLWEWGVIAANAPLEILFPPRTEVSAQPGVSIKNFARASGLMWRMWGVDSAIVPWKPPWKSLSPPESLWKSIPPPRTGVLTRPGAVHAKINILPAAVNTMEASLEVIIQWSRGGGARMQRHCQRYRTVEQAVFHHFPNPGGPRAMSHRTQLRGYGRVQLRDYVGRRICVWDQLEPCHPFHCCLVLCH